MFEGRAFEDEGRRRSDQSPAARSTVLKRLVGRQALEIKFLIGALKHGRQPRSATTSVIADGPVGNRLGNSMFLITIADGPAVRADSNEETARSPHGAEHWSVKANLNSDCQLAGARDDHLSDVE